MTLLALIVPVCCISFGIFTLLKIPKNPNMIMGFRTKRSSSSKEAWEFANSLAGRLMLVIGCAFVVMGLIIFAIENSMPEQVINSVIEIYLYTCITALILSAVLVQAVLCRKFDANGNRRN
jgi:uncharacterized membrane protein